MTWTNSASRSLGWASATAPTPLTRTPARSSGAALMAPTPFATRGMPACPGLMGHPAGPGTSAGRAAACPRRKWRTTELDTDALSGDPEALRRRINSLASKKSRLTKLADYDEKARAELDEVETQLAELRGMRPEKTKTAVTKSVQLKAVREALQSLSAEELEALPEAMRELAKKLG